MGGAAMLIITAVAFAVQIPDKNAMSKEQRVNHGN